MTVDQKDASLRDLIRGYGSVAIAYSGGVDSAYLAAIAAEELAQEACVVLADSPSIPRAEVRDAIALAKERCWSLTVLETQEFENPDYLKNDAKRCYFCKSELFLRMSRFAKQKNVKVLAYGAMQDDLGDDRPGHVAAAEYRVVAPLQDVEMTKDEIREMSRRMGLPTAEKASFACMSSRFPTGVSITKETIAQVEKAEDVLRTLGLDQFRARHHEDLCRVELDVADFSRLLESGVREKLVAGIKAAGYRFVALDLMGYRMGSTAG